MVFSSLLFIWIFLPIVFIGYYIFSDIQYRNVFLLVCSLLFYAWGEPVYILLMFFSILMNWGIGICIEKTDRLKKHLIVFDILLNIGLLGYFKYLDFFIEIINKLVGIQIDFKKIPLPIGISFFTFQIMSYMIDLYKGEYKAQKNILNLALYISFFPQLIAGPIVKYRDIEKQLNNRICTAEKIAGGIRRFGYGFGKKVLISNVLAQSVDRIYALDYENLTGLFAWTAAVLYMMQIYYDFSGYSDMAIGLGKMFGFEFQENFAYPYLSVSIQEFWRRWHISLSTWFKEYLYIPLGGNRKGKIRTYMNLVIVFFATGLWHGASINFVLWGMYHGFFQIIERLGWKEVLKKQKFLAWVYTFMVVNFGWVLFRAESLHQAGVFAKRMLAPWKYTDSVFRFPMLVGNKTIAIAALSVLGCGVFQWLFRHKKIAERMKGSGIEALYCMAVFLLCIAALASNTYNPFIYFRF